MINSDNVVQRHKYLIFFHKTFQEYCRILGTLQVAGKKYFSLAKHYFVGPVDNSLKTNQ